MNEYSPNIDQHNDEKTSFTPFLYILLIIYFYQTHTNSFRIGLLKIDIDGESG